ncbi:hypothetical protein L1049_027030 [Liquidambar formosana]|uniref:Uncharacterized protein n=1 Tax=Liquidambar formosana TaxID=63359 RepID=A0AAP0R7T4_LIQFO
MASIWTLQFHSVSFQPSIRSLKHQISSNVLELRTDFGLNYGHLKCNRKRWCQGFVLRAISSSVSPDDGKCAQEEVVVKTAIDAVDSKSPVGKFQESISSLPPVIFVVKF